MKVMGSFAKVIELSDDTIYCMIQFKQNVDKDFVINNFKFINIKPYFKPIYQAWDIVHLVYYL